MKFYCFKSWSGDVLFTGPNMGQNEWETICNTCVKVAAVKELHQIEINKVAVAKGFEKSVGYFNVKNVLKAAGELIENAGFVKLDVITAEYEPEIWFTKGSRYYNVFGKDIGDKIIEYNKEISSSHLYTDS